MSWQNVKKIKKNKYIKFNKVLDKKSIYLPSYTKSINWNNTKIITSTTDLKTIDNINTHSISSEKIDDNNFIIKTSSSLHTPFNYNYYITESQTINPENYHKKYTLTDYAKRGVLFYTDYDVFANITIMTIFTKNGYAQGRFPDFNLLVNDKFVRRFDGSPITQEDYYYQISYADDPFIYRMVGWDTKLKSENGKVLVKFTENFPSEIYGDPHTVVCAISVIYLASNLEQTVETDVEALLYEEW